MSSVSTAALTATALRMTLTTMPQPQSKCPSLMRTKRPGLRKCKHMDGCCIVDSITVSYLAMSCSMHSSICNVLQYAFINLILRSYLAMSCSMHSLLCNVFQYAFINLQCPAVCIHHFVTSCSMHSLICNVLHHAFNNLQCPAVCIHWFDF